MRSNSVCPLVVKDEMFESWSYLVGNRCITMDKIAGILKEIRSSIGDRAYVAMVLGTALFLFGSHICPDQSEECGNIIRIVSALLFGIGLVEALVRLFVPGLVVPAAKGFGNGLTCGFFAGLIGGLAGYGAHSHSDGWVESTAFRALLVIGFATPIGGVLGACCTLFDPASKMDWRKNTGVILAAILLAFGGLAAIVTTAIPEVQNRGILLKDIELVFELYLISSLVLTAFSSNWNLRKALTALIIPGLVIAGLRLLTNLIPLDPDVFDASHLSNLEFFLPDGLQNFALTLLIGLLAVTATYAISVREKISGRYPRVRSSVKIAPASPGEEP